MLVFEGEGDATVLLLMFLCEREGVLALQPGIAEVSVVVVFFIFFLSARSGPGFR